MTWEELYEFLESNKNAEWWHDKVRAYDSVRDQFHLTNTIEFSDDDVIPTNSIFLVF